MARLTDNSVIMTGINAATSQSVILDLSDADLFSCGTTVTAASGSNILELLESVDGINFVSIATLTITAPGTTIWHVHPVFSRFKKVLYTPGSGAASFTTQINIHNSGVPSPGLGVSKTIGIS